MKYGACLLLAYTLGIGSVARAATIAYTATGATAGANAGNLDIGHQFSVTGTGVTVLDLGVFDAGSDGLVSAHTITLFTVNSGAGAQNASVTPLAGGAVTVPSGTTGALDTGFRFAPLALPLFLAPGNYSVVVYGLNAAGGDPYGNGGMFPAGGNVMDIRFDPFQFTANTSPAYPVQGDANNHASASFHYNLGNTVPEPSTTSALLLLGAGGVTAAWARGHRRRA